MSDAELTPELAQALLAVAREVAQEAAELVRDRAAAGVSVAATKSSDTDVVTEADRAAEALIRERLRRRRPDDAVLGEEGDDVPGTSGVRWIVDPIDGTVNFLYGLPEFAVSVAAEVDGVVVAGVVRNVATGVEYAAHRTGDGVEARRDGRPVAVRPAVPLGQRLVATGFGYDPALREKQGRAVGRLLPRVRDIRRHGSAALELCHVAEGTLDAYVEEGVNLWDYAAGALVAEGAGARVAVLPGASGRSLVVCGGEAGFDELVDAVEQAGFVAS